MRILMVTDFYHPYLGGIEQHVRLLSQALVIRGHEVTVATLAADTLSPNEIVEGVRIVRLHALTQRAHWLFRTATRPWAPPFPDPKLRAGLRHIVEREQPDIIHGHDWLVRSMFPLPRACTAQIVISLHYYTMSCAKKNLMYRNALCSGPGPIRCFRCAGDHYGWTKGPPIVVGNWLNSALEQRAADAYIAVSNATATGNGLDPESPQVEVIPNFVIDLSDGVNDSNVAAYTALLPAEPFLLFVGDLRPDKGINILIDAYGMIESPPPLILIGKVWPESPAELPSNVSIFREWPNTAVRAAMQRAVALVVPSVWMEPFGIVTIEAMAAGIPVVASRIGGIPDIVSDGETGLLVPAGNVPALRDALHRIVADHALRRRLGEAGRARVKQYQETAVVPQIESVYTRLIERSMSVH